MPTFYLELPKAKRAVYERKRRFNDKRWLWGMFGKISKKQIYYPNSGPYKKLIMFQAILIYIVGLLIVNSLLLLWFFSPLKTTLSKIFFKKPLMPHEFDDRIYLKNNFIGELISCFICCSFWLSLAVGVFAKILFTNLILLYPLLTFLTYPSICYIFYKIYSKQ